MATAAEGKVTVYICRCPSGEACRKGNRILSKKLSQQEWRDCIINHLMTSPYHELPEELAANLVDMFEPELWEEDAAAWRDWTDEDTAAWYQARKRPRQPSTPPSATVMLTNAAAVIGAPSGASSSRAVRMYRQGAQMPEDTIAMSRVQMQACLDSLKRARTAAESAAHLCRKAQKAFDEEAKAINSCAEVIETYLD